MGSSERLSVQDHHYVPRGLLRKWSTDGNRIFTYRLLVSDDSVDVWRLRSISAVGYQENLYADRTNSLETWFAREIEEPALLVIGRLGERNHLSKDDWHALVRFWMLQALRTPQRYAERMQWWTRVLPDMMGKVLRETAIQIEEWADHGRTFPTSRRDENRFSGVFRTKLTPRAGGGGEIRAEVTLGRELWLAGIQHVMEGACMDRLLSYRWSILSPATGSEWFLTDDPALTLGYAHGRFDFRTGIDRRHADLLMPLTPLHLLHTEVGSPRPPSYQVSAELTRTIQRALILRAHRMVFATKREDWVPWLRPREVNADRFRDEQLQWRSWAAEQARAELDVWGAEGRA